MIGQLNIWEGSLSGIQLRPVKPKIASSNLALPALLTLNYKIMHSFGAYIVGAIVLVVLYYIFKDSTI